MTIHAFLRFLLPPNYMAVAVIRNRLSCSTCLSSWLREARRWWFLKLTSQLFLWLHSLFIVESVENHALPNAPWKNRKNVLLLENFCSSRRKCTNALFIIALMCKWFDNRWYLLHSWSTSQALECGERVESYAEETRRKNKRGGIGRERGNACKRSQKVSRSGILDSSVPSYWQLRPQGSMVFVKKWHFLSSAFFGQISPEKSVLGILIKNECFLDKEKEVLQKSKTSIFSKEFSPWFLSKKRTFYHLCFLGESSQKRSFFDILDKKECFLDQKNEVLKMFKISKFGKMHFFRLF